jgi:hypothetical protein
MRSDGQRSIAGARAAYGPGGERLSRPRPRLRPGARVSPPARAIARWAGPFWAVLGRFLSQKTVNLVKYFSKILFWTFHVCFLLYFILHQRDKFYREIMTKKVSESKYNFKVSAANLIKLYPLIILDPTRYYN